MSENFVPQYVKVPCPVCGHEKSKSWRLLRGEGTNKCSDCGHVFAQPMPTEETITRAYSLPAKEYKRFFKCEYLDVDGYHKSNYEWQLANAKQSLGKINRLCPGKGRMLELGCSSGVFLECALSDGWETAGVDPEQLSSKGEEIDRKLGIQRTDLFSAHLEKASFDVIFIASVVEHLVDPYRYMLELQSLLKPQGQIFIVGLPNLNSLAIRLNIDRYIGNHPPLHLQFFSKDTVVRLLDRSGFCDVRVKSYGISETILEFLFNRGGTVLTFEYVNILHRKTLGAFFMKIAREVVYWILDFLGMGSVMEVSARKKKP